MNANTKSTKAATPEAPANGEDFETATSFTKLLHRNIERLVGLEKNTLDILKEQSADVAETMRQSMKSGPAVPSIAMLDIAEKGIEGWIGTQKDLLDLTVEQSAHAVKAASKRGSLASQSVAELSQFVEQTAQRAVSGAKDRARFCCKAK